MKLRVLAIALITITVGSLAYYAIDDLGSLFPWAIPIVVAVVVGSLLTLRVPRNPVGWLMLLFAWASVGMPVVITALARDAALAIAIGDAFNTAGVIALPAALLRFPDGVLLSPRWRMAEAVTIGAAVIGFSAALLNGGWGGDFEDTGTPSPLRDQTMPIGDNLSALFYLLMFASMVLASVSLILRYRRSQGEARLKIKWLAFSGGFVLTTFLVMLLAGGWNTTLGADWRGVMVALAFASIPGAIGVAVLQYRLYDIDVVLNRTLVLVVLATFITVVYSLFVVGIGSLISGASEGLALPLAATAVVALAFEPVRHRAQKWANRLVYGRRATPYEVLSDLTQRLSRGEPGRGMLARMAARMGDGTGAERVTIWLGSDLLTPGASWPAAETSSVIPDLDSANVFPVTHDGELVGAFEVVKPRGIALSSAERALIGDLAGSAGAVLGFQRLNDSLESKVRELADSRVRLVEAQDRERRRLERDLHDGAQQMIVSLKVKIGLARAMAERRGAADLEQLLSGLADEAQAALEEVRSLAKGIYPPVLESDGLKAALSALAAGAPVDVIIAGDAIGRFDRDIEAAVYFDVSEAVTNAIKHGASSIELGLTSRSDQLGFYVKDSGPGFDPATVNGGSGLKNMHDRIDAVGGVLAVDSTPGIGTTVSGTIPLIDRVPV